MYRAQIVNQPTYHDRYACFTKYFIQKVYNSFQIAIYKINGILNVKYEFMLI